MKYIPPVIFLLLLVACGKEKKLTLITSEVNTSGVRHIVKYREGRPHEIEFSTFYGSGSRDTTGVDSVIRKEIDSITYDFENSTIKLVRIFNDGRVTSRDLRKFYFNDDGLLTRITRFNSDKEYLTDSVTYNYNTRRALFYDGINKTVSELEYDEDDNVVSVGKKRASDSQLLLTTYYYYDAFPDPFIANLDDDERLFGCFRMNTIGLFWNSATQPRFSSKNNVQAFKEVRGDEETNGLYEYQYKDGAPSVQYGGDNVIYYKYRRETVKK